MTCSSCDRELVEVHYDEKRRVLSCRGCGASFIEYHESPGSLVPEGHVRSKVRELTGDA